MSDRTFMSDPTIVTADICDANETKGNFRVVEPMFQSYGGIPSFGGVISTVKVFEDNSLVKERLGEDGKGKVLVIDGGGSLRCALVGDNLALMGYKNGWRGIVCYGCIRDSIEISQISIGIRALNTNPLRSVKKGRGDKDVPVTFGGVTFHPGEFIFTDEDGILVSHENLVNKSKL